MEIGTKAGAPEGADELAERLAAAELRVRAFTLVLDDTAAELAGADDGDREAESAYQAARAALDVAIARRDAIGQRLHAARVAAAGREADAKRARLERLNAEHTELRKAIAASHEELHVVYNRDAGNVERIHELKGKQERLGIRIRHLEAERASVKGLLAYATRKRDELAREVNLSRDLAKRVEVLELAVANRMMPQHPTVTTADAGRRLLQEEFMETVELGTVRARGK